MSLQVLETLPGPQNRFEADTTLAGLLSSYLSPEAHARALPVLNRMGAASAHELEGWAVLADRNPPRLVPRDRYGNQIDGIDFHPAYESLRIFAYCQGLIGHYYDPEVRRLLGPGLEVVKFAQGYLFAQAEQGLYCPICMTDGCAYLIERYGSPQQKKQYLPRLVSKNPDELWEGAMFLTEKFGGSDVGASQTTAEKDENGAYRLYGEKWFCSNAGAELAMVLARPAGAPAGTAGLGLFAMRRHREDGQLNQVRLQRLKDKLGTRSMATGEYLLQGARAEPVGDLARGFAQMTDMLNLSRLYNATASASLMRRVTTECLRYATIRQTFGRSLLRYPMVVQTLVDMLVDLEGVLHLLFYLYSCRGLANLSLASDQQLKHLRILVPLIKLTSGRQAVSFASEGIELHGGNGYIEDWPLSRFLRDAQVLPIWEGTTNILALDTLRSVRKEGCGEALLSFVESGCGDSQVLAACKHLRRELACLLKDPGQPASLRWCWRAVQCFQASLLAKSAKTERAQRLFEQFLQRHFAPDRGDLRPVRFDHTITHFKTMLEI